MVVLVIESGDSIGKLLSASRQFGHLTINSVSTDIEVLEQAFRDHYDLAVIDFRELHPNVVEKLGSGQDCGLRTEGYFPVIGLMNSELSELKDRLLRNEVDSCISDFSGVKQIEDFFLRWMGDSWDSWLGLQKRFSGIPYIDKQVVSDLVEDMGDREIAKNFLAIYLDELTQRVKDIKYAYCDKSREDLTRISHTLKSASATVGAAKLAASCQELESYPAQRSLWQADTLVAQIALLAWGLPRKLEEVFSLQ